MAVRQFTALHSDDDNDISSLVMMEWEKSECCTRYVFGIFCLSTFVGMNE